MRQSLLTVAMLIAVWLAWMLRDLVMLVGFAALLAYALDPVVRSVERVRLPGRRHMPRSAAAGLVILVLVVIVGASLVEATPRLIEQVIRFGNTAPDALAKLEERFRAWIVANGWGQLLGTSAGSSSTAITSLLGAVQRGSIAVLGHAAGSLAGLLSVILLPLFALYMLADSHLARSNVLGLVPPGRLATTERILDALDRALRAYVRGQALVCLAMGTVMTAVLGMLGFPVALLLGVVVGLGEIVPFLGFWIAATAITLAGYSSSLGLAVTGVIAYAVVNMLMGALVSPRLLGHHMQLHPFVVSVSVIGGGLLLGPPGAILAVPVAAAVKALIDEFGPRRHAAQGRRAA